MISLCCPRVARTCRGVHCRRQPRAASTAILPSLGDDSRRLAWMQPGSNMQKKLCLDRLAHAVGARRT